MQKNDQAWEAERAFEEWEGESPWKISSDNLGC
jgi:hypothetical protein